MDLPTLGIVLKAALSPNPDERKAAEQSLNQVNLFLFTISYLIFCIRYHISIRFIIYSVSV